MMLDLRIQPRTEKLLSDLNDIQPGVWLIETSSITERRKETGAFHSIVRFICYYKQTSDSATEYLTEDSAGNFHKWGNCSFLALLPHDRGWENKHVIVARNRAWAEAAIIRHKLREHLVGEEMLFFNRD